MNKNTKILFGSLCTLLCAVWFAIMALPAFAAVKISEDSPLTEQVEQAQSLLDSEAMAAVEETKKAIAAIDSGKSQEALQALERATGKLDILLARNPKLAFIPLSSTIQAIDVAPQNEQILKDFRNRLKNAIDADNYPEAREILDNLMSEVRTKTLNLPLASYPEAMKEAARLLDTEQPELAKAVLETALSTLVITEKNRPIPIINAQTELVGAIAVAQTDKDDAIRLLEDARRDLQLAKDFGYVSGDSEYAELDKTIKSIEKKVRLDKDIASALSDLQDKLDNFLNRISA